MSIHRNDKDETLPAWRGRSLIPSSSRPRDIITLQEGARYALDFTTFPTTRYQGSKRKIIPWIWLHLNDLDFTSALDVFGGTGAVSYLLKKMGKRVTYNDYLKFNHQIGMALIENDDVTVSAVDISRMMTPVRNTAPTFVSKTFKGIYFTDQENAWIDNAVTRIRELEHAPYEQALMYYGLFQSCLVKRPFNLFHRRNLYVRQATIDRSFGNKTTWERPFSELFRSFCSEVNTFVFKGKERCRAICTDALEVPQNGYDLIYIDPPYLKKDRWNDSYLSYYHFLEGLSRYDEWPSLIDYGTPNLRMKRDVWDVWADRAGRIRALNMLFDNFKASTLVISYKRFGVPSIDTLIKMLKRHGRRVRSHSRHYKYALNHQNGEAAMNREVLIVAEGL